MADLTLNINGNDNASGALENVASSMKGLTVAVGASAAAFVAFAKDSVRAFEEQERADRNLQRAAGDLTQAFKDQASALQSTLGVSDDMVEQMQAMLLRFGQAPADVDKTVRALLDYSAATGTDALSATRTLTSSVESGRLAFKELGIEYDVTGRKSDDLKAVTDALAAKVGGSAEGEAGSLTGSVNKAKQQFGELQESFGKLIADFVTKTGVIDSARIALEAMGSALMGSESEDTKRSNLVDALFEAQRLMRENADMANSPEWTSRRQFEGWKKSAEDAEKAIAAMDAAAKKVSGPLPTSPLTPGDGLTNKAREDRKKAAAELEKENAEALKKQEERAKQAFRDARELEDHEEELKKKAAEEAFAEENRRFNQEWDIAEIAHDKQADEQKKAHDKMLAGLKHFEDANLALFKQQEKDFADAGGAIGGAMVNGFTSAIEQLTSGGSQDPGAVFADIAAGLLAGVGTIVGNIVAPGIGGAVFGGLGSLAGAGIKAAARGGGKRRHDGGWIDAPRYHGGAWVGTGKGPLDLMARGPFGLMVDGMSAYMGTDEQPAILQSGERVLSRSEVAAMGGPGGVDRAVRGGASAGPTVYVQAFDAASTADFMARQGIAAQLKNLRLNRSRSALLFGGS